jgi:hypothetical protein
MGNFRNKCILRIPLQWLLSSLKNSFEYTQNGFSMVTEVKTRLKFTKKNDWANKSVRYYSGSGIKRIFFSDVTYLVSGKIEKKQVEK